MVDGDGNNDDNDPAFNKDDSFISSDDLLDVDLTGKSQQSEKSNSEQWIFYRERIVDKSDIAPGSLPHEIEEQDTAITKPLRKLSFWQRFRANVKAAGYIGVLSDVAAVAKEIANAIITPGMTTATLGAVTVGSTALVLKFFIVAGLFVGGVAEFYNLIFKAKNKNLEKVIRTTVTLLTGFLMGTAIIGGIAIGGAFALGTIGTVALTAPVLFMVALSVLLLWQSYELVHNYLGYKNSPPDSLEREEYRKRMQSNVITLGIAITTVLVVVFSMLFTAAAAASGLVASVALGVIATGVIAYQIYDYSKNYKNYQDAREAYKKAKEEGNPEKQAYYQHLMDESSKKCTENLINIAGATAVIALTVLVVVAAAFFTVGTLGFGVGLVAAVAAIALTIHHVLPRIRQYFDSQLDVNQQLVGKLKHEALNDKTPAPGQQLDMKQKRNNEPLAQLFPTYRHQVYQSLKQDPTGDEALKLLKQEINTSIKTLEDKGSVPKGPTRNDHKHDALLSLLSLLNETSIPENFDARINSIMQYNNKIEQSFYKDDVTFGRTKQIFDAARLYFHWKQDHENQEDLAPVRTQLNDRK